MEEYEEKLRRVCADLGRTNDDDCKAEQCSKFADYVISLLGKAWAPVLQDKATIVKLEQVDDTKFHLSVCLLYTLAVDSRFPYGTNDPNSAELLFAFTTSQLLQASGVTVVDFFKSMRQLRELHPVSDAVQSHLRALEKKFLISSYLYQKFERIMDDVFQEDENIQASDEIGVIGTRIDRRFIWCLFVLAKEMSLHENGELLVCFQLLLCCINTVLQTTPGFKLKPPFDSIRLQSCDDLNKTSMLDSLCSTYLEDDQQTEQVRSLQDSCMDPIVANLQMNNCWDETSLCKKYNQLYLENGDLDEVLFLNCEAHLSIPPVSGTSSINANAVGTQNSTSGGKLIPPSTPVRNAVNAILEIQQFVSGSDSKPSEELKTLFQNCSVNPTEILEARVTTMEQTFLQSYSHVLSKKAHSQSSSSLPLELANQRFVLALRLFYRLLEMLLKKEKMAERDLSHVLNNTSFPACLLACCLHLVLSAHAQNTRPVLQSPDAGSGSSCPAQFPWVLDTFQIEAFDFFKVIESCRQTLGGNTACMIEHLTSMENRIVEQLAWKQNSSLFAALERSQVLLPTIPHTPPAGSFPVPGGEHRPQLSAPHLYLSPVRPHGSSGGRAPVTPTRDVTGIPGESPNKAATFKSHSLSIFLSRVCRFAYQRVQSLCDLLKITRDMRDKVWTCMEHVLSRRFDLLTNRHVDQIIMCSIYAIFKICDREIKFKHIVEAYRHLPHANQEVYKKIELYPGKSDSIIQFYNCVFMQQLKGYLVQFSQAPGVAKPSPLTHSPVPRAPMSPLTRQLQASPVVTLHGRSNFFISPLLDSPFKVPISPVNLTPRHRQTYSFGDRQQSSEKLRLINASVRSPGGVANASSAVNHSLSPAQMGVAPAVVRPTGVSPGPRSQKRLTFEQPQNSQEEEVDMTVKRVRINSPAAKSLNFSQL